MPVFPPGAGPCRAADGSSLSLPRGRPQRGAAARALPRAAPGSGLARSIPGAWPGARRLLCPGSPDSSWVGGGIAPEKQFARKKQLESMAQT